MVLRVIPHDGPRGGCRCYIAGRRVHHGVTGIAMVALGLLLVAHDRRDVRIWFAHDRYTDIRTEELV